MHAQLHKGLGGVRALFASRDFAAAGYFTQMQGGVIIAYKNSTGMHGAQ